MPVVSLIVIFLVTFYTYVLPGTDFQLVYIILAKIFFLFYLEQLNKMLLLSLSCGTCQQM